MSSRFIRPSFLLWTMLGLAVVTGYVFEAKQTYQYREKIDLIESQKEAEIDQLRLEQREFQHRVEDVLRSNADAYEDVIQGYDRLKQEHSK